MDKLVSYIDDRGSLLPIEFKNLPFTPQRIFFVTNVPVDTVRGGHAHYITKQFLICIKGQIEVTLYDGTFWTRKVLNQNESILIPELIWDTQKFLTEGAELLVFCSTEFNTEDYIFDFNKFMLERH
jgi:UDP-2-acetamido-3-amino-2,3-dideoxy-glucuronate N-acetyltransferase